MLPDFEVLHPAYVDPGHGEMVDASGCPKMMPATLEHRLGRALEHVENVVYLLQLGELRHAEERGVARAKALEQERLEAERQRQAEQDTKKVGRSVET
jgi:hypothetical protein